jgi:hypothetical protein
MLEQNENMDGSCVARCRQRRLRTRSGRYLVALDHDGCPLLAGQFAIAKRTQPNRTRKPADAGRPFWPNEPETFSPCDVRSFWPNEPGKLPTERNSPLYFRCINSGSAVAGRSLDPRLGGGHPNLTRLSKSPWHVLYLASSLSAAGGKAIALSAARVMPTRVPGGQSDMPSCPGRRNSTRPESASGTST